MVHNFSVQYGSTILHVAIKVLKVLRIHSKIHKYTIQAHTNIKFVKIVIFSYVY